MKPHFTTKISKNLSQDLTTEFSQADEVWIAVALMTMQGLNFILNNIPNNCKQHYLIGLDLPTDPKALKKINTLQLRSAKVKAKLSVDKEYFHPKVYLIRKGENFSALVGSANCTNGGLYNNIELSTFSNERGTCNDILEWFTELFDKGLPLTTSYINDYQKRYQERLKRKKKEEDAALKEKAEVNKEYRVLIKEKEAFLKVLMEYRKSSDYAEIVQERKLAILDLKRALDYPDFKNIDVENFFKIYDLGHLIPIDKPATIRNLKDLKILLKYLSDENIDIAERYEKAIVGELKVEGVGRAFISKFLAIHNPDEYFVINTKTEKALGKYGIKFPSGLSVGEKYKIGCRFLKEICSETKIQDLAVLDYYLYLEGECKI